MAGILLKYPKLAPEAYVIVVADDDVLQPQVEPALVIVGRTTVLQPVELDVQPA